MKDKFIKLFFIVFLFALSTSKLIHSQDLPRYLTEEEKRLLKTYIPPHTSLLFTNPPSKPVRTMAEWEELDGILITWTTYQSILRQIVDYAQEEGFVYIV
ncbi:MAG: hypothetical protein N3A61_01020, partial [Ignavibacteria bacterium]|nr:hypothetical protein [Ignavibacteria bacterium]